MSSLFIALVLSAPPVDAPSAAVRPEPAVKASAQRGYHEIAKEMRDTMKREALTKSNEEKAAALVELCKLYKELARDPRLSTSDTLKEYKTTIWSRLTRSKAEIKGHLAREKRNAPKGKKPASENSELLAAQASEASQSLTNQLALVSYSLGGPAKVFADGASARHDGAFGGGAQMNYGQDLIDLIEKTIAPDTWDVNGGPGTIVYYPGLMALVVRATSEVHGELGGVLENLRDVGR